MRVTIPVAVLLLPGINLSACHVVKSLAVTLTLTAATDNDRAEEGASAQAARPEEMQMQGKED